MRNKLKVIRAERNLTQEELANQIGVSRQSINSIEKGKYIPSTLLALKLAKSLNLTVEEIFSLE